MMTLDKIRNAFNRPTEYFYLENGHKAYVTHNVCVIHKDLLRHVKVNDINRYDNLFEVEIDKNDFIDVIELYEIEDTEIAYRRLSNEGKRKMCNLILGIDEPLSTSDFCAQTDFDFGDSKHDNIMDEAFDIVALDRAKYDREFLRRHP